MEVILIRHGDPDYANDTLTEKGHAEAAALAEALRPRQIDDIYVSPMGRAQRTMEYTAKVKGLTARTLEWLHELNGNFEGNLWCWNLPGAQHLDRPRLPSHDDWHVGSPFGPLMLPQWQETGRQFDELLASYGYVRQGLRYRVETPSKTVIAMFCHGGLIMTLLSYLLNMPLPIAYSHLWIDTTGLSRLSWEEHAGFAVPRVKVINDLSHLNGLAEGGNSPKVALA